MAYPSRSIGSQVSVVPNHITGNTTRARTRAFVAMCGTFGYKYNLIFSRMNDNFIYIQIRFTLDLTAISVSEIVLIKEQIAVYRSICQVIRKGDLYRIWNPFKVSISSSDM